MYEIRAFVERNITKPNFWAAAAVLLVIMEFMQFGIASSLMGGFLMPVGMVAGIIGIAAGIFSITASIICFMTLSHT
jgi:hypothetical protein